jgi:hypothetical protein
VHINQEDSEDVFVATVKHIEEIEKSKLLSKNVEFGGEGGKERFSVNWFARMV